MNVLQEVLDLEWPMFHNVNNAGGKADCQFQKKTFTMMRVSQFSSWDIPTLEAYWQDLKKAVAEGRNLMTEKYARMMETTAPQEYARFADKLPAIDAKTLEIVEGIVTIQMACRAVFAEKYPKTASAGRKLYTEDDRDDDTSFETYLRAELKTYSMETLLRYRANLMDLLSKRENIIEIIMTTMVKFYGYTSLAECEGKAV